MKIARQFGDQPAIELAFAGQHFGDGRFGNTGSRGRFGLRHTLLLDQKAQQVRIPDRTHRDRFRLIGFDQIAQDIQVILLRRPNMSPPRSSSHDDDNAGIDPSLKAEMQEACERIARSILPTMDERKAAAARIYRMRTENAKRYGVQEVTLQAVRETRSGR